MGRRIFPGYPLYRREIHNLARHRLRYADMVFALHCVKENIEVTPVSIFQERNLDVVDSNTLKMDNAIALFRSR